jgi:transcriptional regulator with XRE-family HTH domain
MPVMTKGPQGDDIVILSRTEYDQLIAATNEDARDAETLRRSIARVKSGEEETFTSAEVDAFLAAKTPLAFFRKKRGMNQDTLAKRAGITQSYLSEIEIGRKSGDIRTLRKLAAALKVSLDSLVPEERSEEDTPRPRAKKAKHREGITKPKQSMAQVSVHAPRRRNRCRRTLVAPTRSPAPSQGARSAAIAPPLSSTTSGGTEWGTVTARFC